MEASQTHAYRPLLLPRPLLRVVLQALLLRVVESRALLLRVRVGPATVRQGSARHLRRRLIGRADRRSVSIPSCPAVDPLTSCP